MVGQLGDDGREIACNAACLGEEFPVIDLAMITPGKSVFFNDL